MSTLKMSRDGRRVLDTLLSLSVKAGIPQFDDTKEAYLADALMLRYHAAPTVQILKSRVPKVKEFEHKHGTIEYWYPMLLNMLKSQSPATRANAKDSLDLWSPKPDPSFILRFGQFSTFVLVDYGHDDNALIHELVHEYDTNEIAYGIRIAVENHVREPRYVKAVLEKERAKKNLEAERMRNLGKVIESSDRLLNQTVHTHTPLDMAQVHYNWQKAREDAEIQRRFDEFLRRSGK